MASSGPLACPGRRRRGHGRRWPGTGSSHPFARTAALAAHERWPVHAPRAMQRPNKLVGYGVRVLGRADRTVACSATCGVAPCRHRRGAAADLWGDAGRICCPDAQPRCARGHFVQQGLLHRARSHRSRAFPRPGQATPAAFHRGCDEHLRADDARAGRADHPHRWPRRHRRRQRCRT